MQESWLSAELTLYTRTVLTPSCLRYGTSRVQPAASARLGSRMRQVRLLLARLAQAKIETYGSM